MKHLKLVTAEDVNPNGLSYDEICEKITKFMDVLDLIQELGLEDDFPQLENQISNLVKAQQSLEEEFNTPPPPPLTDESPSNIIDLSVYFVVKSLQSKLAQEKGTLKEVNGKVINLKKLSEDLANINTTEDVG